MSLSCSVSEILSLISQNLKTSRDRIRDFRDIGTPECRLRSNGVLLLLKPPT